MYLYFTKLKTFAYKIIKYMSQIINNIYNIDWLCRKLKVITKFSNTSVILIILSIVTCILCKDGYLLFLIFEKKNIGFYTL